VVIAIVESERLSESTARAFVDDGVGHVIGAPSGLEAVLAYHRFSAPTVRPIVHADVPSSKPSWKASTGVPAVQIAGTVAAGVRSSVAAVALATSAQSAETNP
jgi:hypothetical protein